MVVYCLCVQSMVTTVEGMGSIKTALHPVQVIRETFVIRTH